jgi:hypothetical protein
MYAFDLKKLSALPASFRIGLAWIWKRGLAWRAESVIEVFVTTEFVSHLMFCLSFLPSDDCKSKTGNSRMWWNAMHDFRRIHKTVCKVSLEFQHAHPYTCMV